MCPQRAWIRTGKVTLVAFVLTFLHCASLNVSSNDLRVKMHSCIGCICLAFLHCVFSDESSNCLPEKRQSHIGCICLAFLHCVFSNADLKILDQSRQSQINQSNKILNCGRLRGLIVNLGSKTCINVCALVNTGA